MHQIKKFKKDHVYLARHNYHEVWYTVHQEGQRTWIASNFSHTMMTVDNVMKGNSMMVEKFDWVLEFDKKGNNKDMRQKMFRILKWGDPDHDDETQDEDEESP